MRSKPRVPRARSAVDELERISYEYGRELGEKARAETGADPGRTELRAAVLDVLRDNGFEPRQVGEDVVLANCPFHALAEQFTALVCSMNLDLLRGVRAAFAGGHRDLAPLLEPSPGMCCVKFCGAADPPVPC